MTKTRLALTLVMASLSAGAAAQDGTNTFGERYAAPLFKFDALVAGDDHGGETAYLEKVKEGQRLMDYSAEDFSDAHVEMSKRGFGQDAQQQTRGQDPIWNGAWIGAGVGAGFALAMFVPFCQDWGCEAGPVIATTAVFAAAGAGIGALIDQALSVAPIVTKGRKGAVVAVRW